MKIIAVSGHRTEKLIEPIKNVSDEVEVVADTSSRLLKRGFVTAKQTNSVISGYNPDVVVGDHAGVSSFAAATVANIRGVPFVLRLGGDIWQINREKLNEHYHRRNIRAFVVIAILMMMNRVTFLLTDGYLSISETVEQAIKENTNVDSNRIGQIRVPLDLAEFENDSGRNFQERVGSNGNRLLLTVTNLRFFGKYDGLSDGLPRIRDALEDCDDIHFVIAGNGMYTESLLEDIDAVFPSHLRDRVHYLGYVDDVQSLYDSADVMVYFSYMEGFGNTIQEAMAAGCPVLANDCEGQGEQIKDGRTGLLVDNPSSESVTEGIKQLSTQGDRREEMITGAREYVQKVAHPQNVGESIITALGSTLEHIDAGNSKYS